MNEAEAIRIICAMLGGQPEESHDYQIADGSYSVRVDCETETHVMEIGLDKVTSRDSVQQAEFFAWVTGKLPMVVIVDRDGVEGPIEYQIEGTTRRLGIKYETFSDDYLLRWQMTSYFRKQLE